LERQAAEETYQKTNAPVDQEKAAALSKEFGKAHGVSSLVNLLVLVAGFVYLVYWFQEIHP
jgi:hypothetical protein